MDREPTEQKDDGVEFNYEGQRPKPNLLDYRYMQIEMSRRADAGKLGMSVVSLVLLTIGCLLLLLLWRIAAYGL